MHDRPKLGEILVQAGVIDELQLASALGEQQRWGRRLGVTLVKLGMVDEGHLIRALAKQLELPVASLGGKRIAEEVIALVPAKMASEHGVIPLFVKREGKGRGHLYLGMEDPSNIEVLDDLSFRTGLDIHPVMVTPSDLGAAIDRYYYGHPEPAHAHTTSSSGRSTLAPATDASLQREPAGETLGMPSLRHVEGDPALPFHREAEGPGADPNELAPAKPEAAPVPETVPERKTETAEPELQLDQEVTVTVASGALPDGLLDDVARALEETERTRCVAKALTQLLIEKGVLDLGELQERIARLKSAARPDHGGDA